MSVRPTGPDLPVVFIAGKGRSGSTVLSMVLGELEGAVAGGELRFLWQRGLVENRNCGCGRPFADCPVWTEVMARVADDRPDLVDEPARMTAAHDRVFRWSAMPRLLGGSRATRGWADLDRWAEGVAALYRALAATAGAAVVVDSSKWPTDPAMLGLVPGIRPIAVQLVRDPRAVAWSWQRRKTQFDLAEQRQMDRYGAGHTSISWVARNAMVEAATARRKVPRVMLRYEDFVADPASAVRRIGESAHVDLDPDGVIDGRSVRRSVNHTVAGNPARFSQGPIELRPDDEWRARLPANHRRLVTILTSPLLGRYGYRIRAPRSP